MKERIYMRSKFEKIGLVTSGAILGVLISLNFPAFAEKTLTPDLPLDDLRTFAEVFGKIKSDYVEPVEDKKLITEALNGMLSGLDPHSSYLDADGFKDLTSATQGEFGGLGIDVGMEDGLVKVIAPIEDTPAFKAGIKTGDLIIKIDETPMRGLSLNDAVKRMRGKPNTPILLTVLRKGEIKPLVFNINRAIIKTQSVKSKLVEPNYAYVRVTQFQEHSGEDLAKALKSMRENNKAPFKGIILDLRNNPGGLVNAAVGIAGAFLPKDDLVVYTEGRATDAKMHLTVNPENYVRGSDDYLKDLPADLKTAPMAVLINNGSASASEIVAGALQDHKRAVIVGTQSFGKGSVQTILPMNNGTAIKLTTARYFTPNGRSIQAKGIEPDIIVEDGSDQSGNIREADLTHHLSNPKDTEAPSVKPTKDSKSQEYKEDAKTSAIAAKPVGPIEPATKADLQYMQALNLLKGLEILKAKQSTAKK